MMDRGTIPNHVEFYYKNKFEKLVHLVGFIIRNVSRCTVARTSKKEVFNLTVSDIATQLNVRFFKMSVNMRTLLRWHSVVHVAVRE